MRYYNPDITAYIVGFGIVIIVIIIEVLIQLIIFGVI